MSHIRGIRCTMHPLVSVRIVVRCTRFIFRRRFMVSWRVFAAVTSVCAVSSAFAQWSENFDSYTAGTDVSGHGGWQSWGGSSINGSLVVNTQSLSAPNSLQNVRIGDTVR